MTTKEIADRLVAYCKDAEWENAQRELFAADAVSIEPYETPEFAKETRGLKAIAEKGRKFAEMVEHVYSLEVSSALVAGNSIALTLTMDIKMKGQERYKAPELCVYQVKDGKIISEQFFV
jgi:hypothetical protein